MITSSNLQQHLQNITTSKCFLIAYSGGLDSHVLLHLLSQIENTSFKIRALYINHGLQEEADDWAIHCKNVCDGLGVAFQSLNLNLHLEKGESLEEVARKKRYKTLHSSLQEDEVLVTAHHQNDQAETLLLQLFRGAGVQGLASMPAIREFGPKADLRKHMRPLLNQTRQSLEDYAKLHKLNYIEDPSNSDQAFDRNFLRNIIMPQLRQRWIGIDKTISRAASIQAETKQILDEVAEADLSLLVEDDDTTTNTLPISKLLKHTEAKQKLVVRYWISKNGFVNPSDKKLKHIFTDAIHASEDSQPLLEWQGAQIRRYHNRLYLLSPLLEHDATAVIPWDGVNSLEIPSLDLIVKPEDLPQTKQVVTIRFRQGGEKVVIPKRGSISLKNLLQEAGVPPWVRSRLPLIYVGEKLVKIIGVKRHPPLF